MSGLAGNSLGLFSGAARLSDAEAEALWSNTLGLSGEVDAGPAEIWVLVGQGEFTVQDENIVGPGSDSDSLPGGIAQNDVVVAITAADVAVLVVNNGYTTQGLDTSSPGFRMSTKRMGVSPDSTISVNRRLGFEQIVIWQVWRGANTTTLADVAAAGAGGSGANPDPPSVTTVTDNALVIAAASIAQDAATSITAPSGYTNLLTSTLGGANPGTVGATVMMASKIVAVAGAENPGVFSTNASDVWRAQTFAMRPAA